MNPVVDATPATEIVVQGSRREDRGVLVTTIDEKQIERIGTWSVGETLERLPAVNGASGGRGERLLSLRGFDQRQITVFVDGIPIYVPYDGQLDLAKLPIDMVSRVTVVKSAGSLLYGPNGLGGAVSIVTREPTSTPSLSVSSESSLWNATRASVVGNGSLGPVSGIVGAGYQGVRYLPMSSSFQALPNESGDHRKNSDKKLESLASKWTWDLDDRHRLTLSASRFGGTFGVPPATHDFTVRYWRWTDWSSSTMGLSHTYRSRTFQVEELIYGSLFSNTLDAYDDARYATQRLPKAFHSIYDDTALGGFVRTTALLPMGERRLRFRTWTGLKHDIHSGMADRNADTITVSTNTLTTSAQAEIDLLPRWARASFGTQFDGELPDTPPSGPKPAASSGMGPIATIGVTPGRAWDVSFSAASRTRFPTLRERFSTVFGSREPNPLLRPERAWNFSLDAVFRPDRALRVAAGLFDSELRDLVTQVMIDPQVDQMQNASRARFYGSEIEASWSPKPWVQLLAGWMYLHVRSGDALDQPIAYRPNQKGLVMATFFPIPNLAVTGVFRYIGEQDFQNPDTLAWGTLGAYPMFDARIEWNVHALSPRLRAWVRATNLLDANVEGRYSFPEAGREVFFGFGTRIEGS